MSATTDLQNSTESVGADGGSAGFRAPGFASAPDPWSSVGEVVGAIPDPELPMLSIADLGILRGVREEAGTVVVEITPTYSGCPAVDAIRDDILRALDSQGIDGRVDIVLSPAWTTDWMTDAGRQALADAGIAPPAPRAGTRVSLGLGIRCPRCGSMHTRELSHFGSTACKALWVCERCHEPFDRFKELGPTAERLRLPRQRQVEEAEGA